MRLIRHRANRAMICLLLTTVAATGLSCAGSADPSAAATNRLPNTVRVVAAAVPTYVRPESFGAVGNGVTDDSLALQKAFDAGHADVPVLLQAGRTYAHSAVLRIHVAGEHVIGGGTLLASKWLTSSVWVEADNVVVENVAFRTATTTRRGSTWEQMGVRIVGHSGVVLRRVTVVGSVAAGIYVGGAANFELDRVTVTNTLADGIHITAGSHNGKIISPTVRNSHDDGVAVVSYSQDGAPCHDITVTSPRVLGTSWGRGLSVVGGTNITETNVDVESTDAAAIYIAAEGNPWYTTAPVNVTFTGGKIIRANTDPGVDHGAVLVLAGETGITPKNIGVSHLTISGTRASASRNFGVVTYGTPPQNVHFENLTITGGPTSAYSGNTPQSSYRIRNVTRNGVRLPDAG